jgi:hypothetical protein
MTDDMADPLCVQPVASSRQLREALRKLEAAEAKVDSAIWALEEGGWDSSVLRQMRDALRFGIGRARRLSARMEGL